MMPKFEMNEKVLYEVSTAANDHIQLSEVLVFTIVGIRRTSSSTHVEYLYDLSRDPPLPYHSGRIDFERIPEKSIEKLKEKE